MKKLIKAINNATNTFKKTINTPDSFIKGEEFETFVKDKLFPKEEFELLHETPTYSATSERFNSGAQLPDLKFRNKKTKEVFWIECKFRGTYDVNYRISVTSIKQIKRNQKLKEPLFYIIGFMGKPKKPLNIYQIPLKNIYPKVYFSHAKKFQIHEG